MTTGEVKEWVKVSHSANNQTSVSVTLQDGTLTVRWAVKSYADHIKEGVVEARKYANKALEQLREAVK